MQRNGFTLLELIIALGIFSLVSVMAFSGFHAVKTSSKHVEQVSGELSKLQMAFLLMGRDMQQAIARSIRDNYGDEQAALTGSGSGFGNMLEFTRTGWVNPLGQQRSAMQRVAYGVKEDNLVRMSWPMLDRVQGSEPREAVLLKDVKGFELRFLNLEGQWVSEWPPLVLNEEESAPNLPKAIEVTLEMEGWGKLVRLFPMAGDVALPVNEIVGGDDEEET